MQSFSWMVRTQLGFDLTFVRQNMIKVQQSGKYLHLCPIRTYTVHAASSLAETHVKRAASENSVWIWRCLSKSFSHVWAYHTGRMWKISENGLNRHDWLKVNFWAMAQTVKLTTKKTWRCISGRCSVKMMYFSPLWNRNRDLLFSVRTD